MFQENKCIITVIALLLLALTGCGGNGGSSAVVLDGDSDGDAPVVLDEVPPVISLNGSDSVDIEAGTTYADPGAMADDDVDGDISADIFLGGDVIPVPATVGIYTITYDVADAAGNDAIQVTRSVVVKDTPPVIELSGSASVTVEAGSIYTDAGATATDRVDGDITENIVVGGDLVPEPATGGPYLITYDVSDSAGNSASQISRIVTVTDTTAPVITLNGDASVAIEAGGNWSDPGGIAADNNDGLVPVTVGGDSIPSPTTVGIYQVTYDAQDLAGYSAAQVTRTVTVVDTTAPLISLKGSASVEVEVGASWTDPGAVATDNNDASVTVTVSGDKVADPAKQGIYTIIYNAQDAAKNSATSVTRTVTVADTTPPLISLIGSASVALEAGVSWSDPGATANDAFEGDLTGSIAVGGDTVPDPATVGIYAITYDVTDAASNAAIQVTRTVTVGDTTPPVITLNGTDPATIFAGETWADPVEATDNNDGDISGNVIIGGDPISVPATEGVYVLTYDVTDAADNDAIQVTRTLNVANADPPVIVINGVSPTLVEAGTTYVDAGATAEDYTDGDLTGMITVGGQTVPDPATVGTYNIIYGGVIDNDGKVAEQVIREVTVLPSTPPVITLNGPASVTIEAATSYVEAGATATDNVDLDVSANIVVGGDAVPEPATMGVYAITYDVDDAAGNSAVQVTRTVTVVDTTAPVISLLGSASVTVEAGFSWSDPGATATDANDGDLSSGIGVGGAVVPDPATVGSYIITYDVADAASNSAVQVTRTVTVTDTTAPVITLVGSDLTIEAGTSYVDAGATVTDNNDVSAMVVAAGAAVPDPATVGVYVLTYDWVDAAGNAAAQVSRTVSVVDTTAPVISLNGDAVVGPLEAGTDWSDPGATAVDNNDGDLTASIEFGGDVVPNPVTVGTYTITYDVVDAAALSADQVTRTVNVADTTAPLITLIGDASVTLEAGTSWSDPGATATDNNDTSVTVDVSGDVVPDPATVGVYVITYDATDAANNVAIQVTRQVDVIDSPQVSVTVPAGGNVGVPPDSNVTISWDLAIDCSTVDETSISSDSPGWHFVSCADNYAIFSSIGQDYATQYQVNVTDVVTSIVGTPMAAAESFSYTVTDPPPTWLGTELLGRAGDDLSNLGTTDAAGNIYLVGSTEDSLFATNQGGSDIFVVKESPSGAVLWELQFGGIDDDVANGVVVSGSSVYVVGDTFSGLGVAVPGDTLGGLDGFLAKIDADVGGAPQWVRQFGTDGSDVAWSVAVDGGGFIYVSGVTDGVLAGGGFAGDDDAFLCRFEGDGTRAWAIQYGSEITTDDAVSVAVGPDGLIYVAGESGAVDLNGDAYAASYSPDNGDLVGGPWLLGQATDTDYANALVLDDGGNIYIAGLTATDIDGDGIGVQGVSDAFLAKIDPYAATPVQWSRVVASTDYDEAFGVDVDSFGNLYVSGEVDEDIAGITNNWAGAGDIFTTRYTLDGTRNWLDLFGTTFNDVGYDLFLGEKGMVFVTGATEGDLDNVTNAGLSDAFLARYTSGGVLE